MHLSVILLQMVYTCFTWLDLKHFIHIAQGHENRKYIKDRCMSVGIGSLAIGLNGIRMTLTSDSFPKALRRKVYLHAVKGSIN